MKKLVSLTLALTLCLALATPALADVEIDQDGLVSGAYTYQVNADGTAVIVAFNKDWTYGNHNVLETLSIPATLDGHAVTSIASYAFTYYMPDGTKTIVIPEGVQRIESDAFLSMYAGASNEVETISVPSTVTYIGDGAFSNQSALKQFICHAADVTVDGENAFYGVADCTFYGKTGSAFNQYFDAMPKTYKKEVTDTATWSYKLVDVDTNNVFKDISSAPSVGGTSTPAQPQPTPAFSDVPAGTWFSASVEWAVEQGITVGTSATAFSPNETCTRGQIITFLYRAAGSPAVSGTASVSDAGDTYYTDAVNWAAENGLFSGSAFSPEAPCTREMAVEFMWKRAGSPDAAEAGFEDVTSDAVNWALEAGVTTGTSDTAFSPDDTCTRAEIVTFLYRAFGE